MNIQIFNNPNFGEVRVTEVNSEPVFCLSDICKVLDLQTTDVRQRLDDGVVSIHPIIDALGRTQQANFVNEDGLYDVILDSRKPEAKLFRKWITSEILPSIRKHGGYMVSKPDDTPEVIMARALQIAQRTIENHRQRVQILEGKNEHLANEVKTLIPKAEYTDKVLQSTSTYTMTQVAKELGMSAIALERRLHDAGVMFKQSGQWILYAKYQNKGYTKPRTHHYTHCDGSTGTNTITVFTESGRAFIHSFIRDEYKDKNSCVIHI
ncbi:MAG: phage antirepressor KilAC domain-containing protein [Dysgonamonadaceae bacterium]|jgi:prophage antirepressor-like protein|nr:phage antirepressor KilAC domain-containing protein [Dysgonamonadaceae bacterium]